MISLASNRPKSAADYEIPENRQEEFRLLAWLMTKERMSRMPPTDDGITWYMCHYCGDPQDYHGGSYSAHMRSHVFDLGLEEEIYNNLAHGMGFVS